MPMRKRIEYRVAICLGVGGAVVMRRAQAQNATSDPGVRTAPSRAHLVEPLEAALVVGQHVGGHLFVQLRQRLVVRERRGCLQRAHQLLLTHPATHAPIEEGSRGGPRDDAADHALGEHALGPIVEVGDELAERLVVGQQLRLALLNVLGADNAGGLVHGHPVQLLVDAGHGLEHVGLAELDLGDAGRLEHAAPRRLGGVHFHEGGVDLGVDDHPCAAADLAKGRDVDGDWLAELRELVDDEGAELEHLLEHVLAAAREAAPVGQDEQRQPLAGVEVLDGLRGLVGRVGEPDLPGLHLHLRLGLEVGGIGQDGLLDQPVLGDDAADRHAAQPPAADHHRLGPVCQRLHEGAVVEQAVPESAVLHPAGQQRPGVVRDAPDGEEVDGADDGVGGPENRQRGAHLWRDEAEPLHDFVHRLQVVVDQQVRDAVAAHHLGPAQLQVGLVHGRAQQLVQRHVPRQDNGRVALLDDALAEPQHVRADADVAGGAVGQREDLPVGDGRLGRDSAGALQRLDAQPVLGPDDGHDLVVRADGGLFGLVLVLDVARGRLDHLGHHRVAERLLVLVGEPQVRDALGRVVAAHPLHTEAALHRVGESEAGAGVGRHVDARHAQLARVLRGPLEDEVLHRAKCALREGDVVGDDDDGAAGRDLGRVHGDGPGHHADLVGAPLAQRVERPHARPVSRESQLGRGQLVDRHGHSRVGGRRLVPRGGHCDLEQVDKVIAVGCAQLLAAEPLLVNHRQERVRLQRHRRPGVGRLARALGRPHLQQPERAVGAANLLVGVDRDGWAEPADDAGDGRLGGVQRGLGCGRVPQRQHQLQLGGLERGEGGLILGQDAADGADDVVQAEAERRGGAEEEVVRLRDLVARVADGLLERGQSDGHLRRAEGGQALDGVVVLQRGRPLVKRPDEEPGVERLLLGRGEVDVRVRRVGEPTALHVEVGQPSQLEHRRLGRQDVPGDGVLVVGLRGDEVVDGDVVEVVGDGRVGQHHRHRLDRVCAQEAGLGRDELGVHLGGGHLVHHRVGVRPPERLVRQAALGVGVERLVLAQHEHVQAHLGRAGEGGRRRGGQLLERLGRRVARHGLVERGRGAALLGALFLERQPAQVVKVGLEVVVRLEGEQDAKARLARVRRVLPRHGRLLLALAQVRLEGDVGHAALLVPEHHARADDGALERLVRGGDHREQLGLAQLELRRHARDDRQLALVAQLAGGHPLELRQHQLLVGLGDVVPAVGDDLLGLALHAQVLGG
mmetsp:Transcript_5307/g.17675  ORF Transcript_5307/g.17675 Transcript_5307/m.17675 type:complete len:1245 (-) Transcript_5307:1871-5605(-)